MPRANGARAAASTTTESFAAYGSADSREERGCLAETSHCRLPEDRIRTLAALPARRYRTQKSGTPYNVLGNRKTGQLRATRTFDVAEQHFRRVEIEFIHFNGNDCSQDDSPIRREINRLQRSPYAVIRNRDWVFRSKHLDAAHKLSVFFASTSS